MEALSRNEKKAEKYIYSVPIYIPKLTESELTQRAFQSYEQLTHKKVQLNSLSDSFRHRIIVNYLRHSMTPYNELIKHRHTQLKHGLMILLTRIFTIISELYPYLQEECLRQASQKLNIKI